ncbi:MAG: HNH endonuclease [Thermodesulfobacteriota bacterium]
MHNIEVIKLSKNDINNGSITISAIIDFFPSECLGGKSSKDPAKKQMTIVWDNDKSITSDIVSDTKIIREKSWFKKFISKFNLKEKDLIAFEKIYNFRYKVYPINKKRLPSDNKVLGYGDPITFRNSQISYNAPTTSWEIDGIPCGSISELSKSLYRTHNISSFNYCTHPIGSILENNGVIFNEPFCSRRSINPVLCSSRDELEKNVKDLLPSIQNAIPIGQTAPQKRNFSTSDYIRDAAVVAYVLDLAQGMCECCRKKAPFLKNKGIPFLEVHHVQQLSKDGSDTISNAIAVCPNCHKELHFGEHRRKLTKSLYDKVERLTKTGSQGGSIL